MPASQDTAPADSATVLPGVTTCARAYDDSATTTTTPPAADDHRRLARALFAAGIRASAAQVQQVLAGLGGALPADALSGAVAGVTRSDWLAKLAALGEGRGRAAQVSAWTVYGRAQGWCEPAKFRGARGRGAPAAEDGAAPEPIGGGQLR